VINCYITLLHCLNKGFLITFDQLHFKQSSSTRSKCLTYTHCAHSQVTNDGQKILKPSGRGRKRVGPFFLMKGRQLTVDVNGYALPCGYTRGRYWLLHGVWQQPRQ